MSPSNPLSVLKSKFCPRQASSTPSFSHTPTPHLMVRPATLIYFNSCSILLKPIFCDFSFLLLLLIAVFIFGTYYMILYYKKKNITVFWNVGKVSLGLFESIFLKTNTGDSKFRLLFSMKYWYMLYIKIQCTCFQFNLAQHLEYSIAFVLHCDFTELSSKLMFLNKNVYKLENYSLYRKLLHTFRPQLNCQVIIE